MPVCFFFFFNDTATTEIYTLSLHDALPICRRIAAGAEGRRRSQCDGRPAPVPGRPPGSAGGPGAGGRPRSEEHTSELQSRSDLVCRLLLEKKNNAPERSEEPMQIHVRHCMT